MAWVTTSEAVSDDDRSGMRTALLGTWAHRDPEAAGGWVRTLAAPEDRDRSAAILAGILVDSQPEGAVAWLRAIGDETTRTSAAGETFDRWIADDPGAAVPGLVALFPALDDDPALRRSLLDALARHDPAFRDALLDEVDPR